MRATAAADAELSAGDRSAASAAASSAVSDTRAPICGQSEAGVAMPTALRAMGHRHAATAGASVLTRDFAARGAGEAEPATGETAGDAAGAGTAAAAGCVGLSS